MGERKLSPSLKAVEPDGRCCWAARAPKHRSADSRRGNRRFVFLDDHVGRSRDQEGHRAKVGAYDPVRRHPRAHRAAEQGAPVHRLPGGGGGRWASLCRGGREG